MRGNPNYIHIEKEIDFENNMIHIRRSLPKTKEDRIVTLDPLTMKEIYEYRKIRKGEIMKIRDKYKGFESHNGEHLDLLFANINRIPYSPHSVSQFWSRIVKRFNLKKISFYDLRHSSASYLLLQGFSMKIIQERLGQKLE